jgi:hypothetical protein
MAERIARWESRRGKHWVELVRHCDGSFGYTGDGSQGSLGKIDLDSAMQIMATRTAEGAYFFCPGKSAMDRVTLVTQVSTQG